MCGDANEPRQRVRCPASWSAAAMPHVPVIGTSRGSGPCHADQRPGDGGCLGLGDASRRPVGPGLQDLRVLHGDRRGHREQLPDVRSSNASWVRVHVHRAADRAVGEQAAGTARCAPRAGRRGDRTGATGGRHSSDPDRMVCPVWAALMQGSSTMPYLDVVDVLNEGVTFTMVSVRPFSSRVNPAPSAPGMARTAKVATWVSRSSRDNRANASRLRQVLCVVIIQFQLGCRHRWWWWWSSSCDRSWSPQHAKGSRQMSLRR